MLNRKTILLSLGVLIIPALWISLSQGAVHLTLDDIFNGFSKGICGNQDATLAERIFWELRLPRTFLSLFTGAALAVGGVLLQGLFRNPIVEPGLIGTSSGAAFGASLYFVLGVVFPAFFGSHTLQICAALGSLLATVLVYAFHNPKRKDDNGILLAGVALNALFISGVGFMSYLARDPQARSIAFWNLGTLSGASHANTWLTGGIVVLGLMWAFRLSKGLNAMLLGEDEAGYLGLNANRFRWQVMIVQVILVAGVTSTTGVIAFLGLTIPHVLRILGGSDHRYLITGSALLGGISLVFADVIARVVLAPAEVPVGIITSVFGAPLFLAILRKQRKNGTYA